MTDAKRTRLVRAIETMPDEAFAWLVLACAPHAMMHGAGAQIWPDGIGGFTAASRAAIEEARAAAAAWLTASREAPK
jgi:hypothetical protein